MHNPVAVLDDKAHEILWDTDGSINSGKKINPSANFFLNRGICHLVDFAVPANHRVKLKENENMDKYLELAGELN